ncbi:MAG: M20/M25/M40 family metallo-hydrolase [Vicinamibacterales bacterium]
MDPIDPVALARELIDIDSTTGREGEAARYLSAFLRGRGYSVLEQPLGGDAAPERVNVIAAAGEPALVFSTHIDCVPPFFPSRLEDGRLYGRGACDAKGILAAQVAAAERLRASGESRVGLVFVCGEERGSEGARAANRMASRSRFLVNGEPTDNRLGLATRGVLRVTLVTAGVAAHSGYPELGRSAIEAMVDLLTSLRTAPWPEDAVPGRTHYTVGLMSGGVAPNVIPAHAEAELNFRTVGPHDEVRAVLRDAVGDRAEIREILEVPPVHLTARPGFETAVFAYTTDIPLLSTWGTPLLLGPGSIHVAHTDHEHIRVDELVEAIDLYEKLARLLLAEA